MNDALPTCVVCGGSEYTHREILWPELVDAWKLSPEEVDYINRQQGTMCTSCGVSFRSNALAKAIMRHVGFDGLFLDFLESDVAKNLSVIEFNTAGKLSEYLERIPGRKLLCYPDYDMMNIDLPDKVDLVVHSDTLEHVPNPVRALAECKKLLAPGGACCFTVPIIVDRFSRSREGLEKSFHATRGNEDESMRVWYEFGADVWTYVLKAGFANCALEAFEYPTSMAIIATL